MNKMAAKHQSLLFELGTCHRFALYALFAKPASAVHGINRQREHQAAGIEIVKETLKIREGFLEVSEARI